MKNETLRQLFNQSHSKNLMRLHGCKDQKENMIILNDSEAQAIYGGMANSNGQNNCDTNCQNNCDLNCQNNCDSNCKCKKV